MLTPALTSYYDLWEKTKYTGHDFVNNSGGTTCFDNMEDRRI